MFQCTTHVVNKQIEFVYNNTMYSLLNCLLSHVTQSSILLKDVFQTHFFKDITFLWSTKYFCCTNLLCKQCCHSHCTHTCTHTRMHVCTHTHDNDDDYICAHLGHHPPQHNKILQKMKWFAHSAYIQQIGGFDKHIQWGS